MKKKIVISITAVSLLFIFLFACQSEIDIFANKEVADNKELLEAKGWYNSQHVGGMKLKCGSESYRSEIEPAWENFITDRDEEYKTVEMDIYSEYHFGFYAPECVKKFKESNDSRYLQSMTRFIVRTNKETGERDGFFMTVTPDLAYLEKSNFEPFKEMSYLKRDKTFSGFVFYHNMEGEYTNSWLYRDGIPYYLQGNGEASLDRGPKLKSTYCEDFYTWYIVQRCYYTSAGGNTSLSGCTYTYELEYSFTRCQGYTPPGGSSENWVDRNGGGGGGGGGYVPPAETQREKQIRTAIQSTPKEAFDENGVKLVDLDRDGEMDGYLYKDETGRVFYREFAQLKECYVYGMSGEVIPVSSPKPIREIPFPKLNVDWAAPGIPKIVAPATTDCNSVATAAIKSIMAELNKFTNINEAFDIMRKYAQMGSKDEIGMVIDKNNANQITFKFYQGNGSTVDLPVNSNSYIKAHIHPYYGYSAPSGSDIYKFMIQARSYSNYEGMIVIAADGTEYMLYADDRSKLPSGDKLSKWITNNYEEFIDDEMDEKYRKYYNSSREQGYSNYQANEYTMAQLINEFAPGLKLYRKSFGEPNFKQMNPSKDSNNNLTPKLCDDK